MAAPMRYQARPFLEKANILFEQFTYVQNLNDFHNGIRHLRDAGSSKRQQNRDAT